MRMNARSLTVAASGLAVALTVASNASADAAGDKLLGEVDAIINKPKTLRFEYDVVNQEPGKPEKKLAMKVAIKGAKRFSEFTAPGDMKGTKFLILSPTEMYVYLPAFGKVRRVASHVSEQGFLGLAFTQDDFANTTYTGLYSAAIASQGDKETSLTLTPKAGVTAPYSKIELKISKDKKLPTELKYYNAAGKHWKTETRTGYTCEGEVCTPGELKMVDHLKGGHWSKFIRKSWKVNDAISDETFSKRNLGE